MTNTVPVTAHSVTGLGGPEPQAHAAPQRGFFIAPSTMGGEDETNVRSAQRAQFMGGPGGDPFGGAGSLSPVRQPRSVRPPSWRGVAELQNRNSGVKND